MIVPHSRNKRGTGENKKYSSSLKVARAWFHNAKNGIITSRSANTLPQGIGPSPFRRMVGHGHYLKGLSKASNIFSRVSPFLKAPAPSGWDMARVVLVVSVDYAFLDTKTIFVSWYSTFDSLVGLVSSLLPLPPHIIYNGRRLTP